MSNEITTTIVSKVWGLCAPLRDDGVSYGDYLEQLTYLIFLKMSDEYAKPPYQRKTDIPSGYGWNCMCNLKGAELEEQYRATLEKLGEQGGILGKIFKGSTNKISNAAILFRIVQMIDKEKWVSMSSDVKGEIYEGLLQKNAEDVKSGAGQYFTPRPLIKAMVRCVRPKPMQTICDPCCGSGGFLLASQEFLTSFFQTGCSRIKFVMEWKYKKIQPNCKCIIFCKYRQCAENGQKKILSFTGTELYSVCGCLSSLK